MTFQEFLTWLKDLIEESVPALAVLLWDYKQEELDESKNDTLKAQEALEIEKNHEQIDAKYAGKSDDDILGITEPAPGTSTTEPPTSQPPKTNSDTDRA